MGHDKLYTHLSNDDIHRILNDSTISTTTLWSSSKIESRTSAADPAILDARFSAYDATIDDVVATVNDVNTVVSDVYNTIDDINDLIILLATSAGHHVHENYTTLTKIPSYTSAAPGNILYVTSAFGFAYGNISEIDPPCPPRNETNHIKSLQYIQATINRNKDKTIFKELLDIDGLYLTSGYYTSGTSGTSASPSASYVQYETLYGSALLCLDNKLFLNPHNAQHGLILDLELNTFITTDDFTSAAINTQQYKNSTLLDNGTILLLPWKSRIAKIFNPFNHTVEDIDFDFYAISTTHKLFNNAIRLPNGDYYLCPKDSYQSYKYTPATNTVDFIYTSAYMVSAGPGEEYMQYEGLMEFPVGGYSKGVLTYNKIFHVPWNATQLTIYDIDRNYHYNNSLGYTPSASEQFSDGVLLPNGQVYCVPYNSPFAIIYNPNTDAITISGNGLFNGNKDFIKGQLLPNGLVLLVPYNNTQFLIYDYLTDTYNTIINGYNDIQEAYIDCVMLKNNKVFILPNKQTSNLVYVNGLYDKQFGMSLLTNSIYRR